MSAASPSSASEAAASHALFRALWDVGLDRKQLSIHEMLVDILEVVEVAEGYKPAFLAGQGEGAVWRIDEFERISLEAGLLVLRTSRISAPVERRECAAEKPGATPVPRDSKAPQVLWVYRQPSLAAAIRRLVTGDAALVAEVLGYPRCCAEHEARSEWGFMRALSRRNEQQQGFCGERTVLEPVAAEAVRPGLSASAELESVWRSRLSFPFLGYTACPHCLARHETSACGRANRRTRALAFRLDPAYARAVWRAALQEAALITCGNFQALDPLPSDLCPCGSGQSYAACCAGHQRAMPEFR